MVPDAFLLLKNDSFTIDLKFITLLNSLGLDICNLILPFTSIDSVLFSYTNTNEDTIGIF